MGAFNVAPPPYLDYDDTDVMSPLNPMNIAAYGMLRPRNPGVEAPDITPPPPTPASAPVDMVGNLPQAPVYVPGVNAPKTPDDTYADAMSELEAAYGQRPQMAKPKWWQRALGAGLGFGAGWSNAASRTRNPINIGAMEENVLEPGYNESLQRWQQNVLAPAQTKAEIESAKQAAWWKSQQLQAQAEMMKEHGAYWQHRAEMEQNQWKIDPKSGTIYNTITGERSAPPPTPKDRYVTAKAISPDMPEDMAQYYALNGSLAGYGGTLQKDTPTKPLVLPAGAAYVDPTTGEPIYTNPRTFAPGRGGRGGGTGTSNQFKQVEQKKGDRLNTARAFAQKQLQAAAPEDQQKILDDLSDREQLIQNEYESEVTALGGEPEHYEVPPERLENFPGVTGETPGTKGGTKATPTKAAAAPYTEDQVRAAAKAKGKDPDAAVRMARERKLIS